MLNGHLLKRAHAKLPTEEDEIAALRARYRKVSPEERKKVKRDQIADRSVDRTNNLLKQVASSPDLGT